MIKSLIELNIDESSKFGGKAISLSNLIKNGFNVPGGISLSNELYAKFIGSNSLMPKIGRVVDEIDFLSIKSINKAQESIFELMKDSDFNGQIVLDHLEQIEECPDCKYAVRSSCIFEDLPNASFAGQYDTFLNVGHNEIINKVIECYASIYTSRSMLYRKMQGFPLHVDMGVVIQNMINPDCAGVVFTVSPQKNDCMVIELAPGLGENVVSGLVTPNSYYYDRNSKDLVEHFEKDVIDKDILMNLVESSFKIEKIFGTPQDIEFAIKGRDIYFLQTRNITTIKN